MTSRLHFPGYKVIRHQYHCEKKVMATSGQRSTDNANKVTKSEQMETNDRFLYIDRLLSTPISGNFQICKCRNLSKHIKVYLFCSYTLSMAL